jgi:enamine deaminase RidA (YjgF/YER057c/UK114 family)
LKHQSVSTSNQWESAYGYARAVRAANMIFTTGTVAVDENAKPFAINDPYAQAARCYEIIEKSIGQLGASKHEIVRTRMFVTDITMSDAFGRAHKDFFAGHTPCLTMVEVAKLIDDAFLVEIEAEAVAESN